MGFLPSRDRRQLLDWLHELYAVRGLDDFPGHVTARLPGLVASEVVSYNEINVPRRRCVVLSNSPELTAADVRVFERHVAEHPLIGHYRRTGDGRALKISDFLTMRQFRDLGLYREVFAPRGLSYQMAATLPSRPPLVIGMAMTRDRDFSERDRLVVNTLRPHLIAAYRNAEALAGLRRQVALGRRAVEAVGAEVVRVSDRGRIRGVTARASAWLCAYFEGWGPGKRRLPDALGRWVRSMTALDGATDDVPPPRRPLVVAGARGHLIIRLLEGPGERLVVLQERPAAPDARTLEPLGLTPREAEVLAWLALGKGNADIATILGMRPRTVHKHLDRVFQKLGVENRTAAAAQALAWASAASNTPDVSVSPHGQGRR